MRISGGVMRGRKLALKRAGVRPTKESVREALFSAISARIPGCSFLDLFAGSGIVGFEAMSRGASQVVWVDSGKGQVRDISGWVERVGSSVECECRVVCQDVISYLEGWRGGQVEVVFADPPYDRSGREGWLEQLTACISEQEVLTPEGILIMEVAASEDLGCPEGWRLLREKRYGDTGLWIYKESESAK